MNKWHLFGIYRLLGTLDLESQSVDIIPELASSVSVQSSHERPTPWRTLGMQDIGYTSRQPYGMTSTGTPLPSKANGMLLV